MRIHHLIDGKSVEGRDYFETVNPATQEVLAEVASGGADEINAAVAAAKNAFPKWAATPAPERAKMMVEHGKIGRSFHGQVTQVISGSIGFKM